jgi:hypothetical protein
MPANPNLDALIPRDDFEVLDEGGSEHSLRDAVDISSLEKGHFFYESLRKPDFQRETANWPAEKIVAFVRTFLDGDLVPGVILWKSQGNTFVIDGAHRLSALIAWVNDDYGDGRFSMPFFQNRIPDEQRKAAEQTRQTVKKSLGSYADYRAIAQIPDPSKPEMMQRVRRLGSFSIKVQWVTGDAKKAEESFFKINQEATPIDKTELRILRSRKSPSAIAARAILRAGTGHRYWSSFDETEREKIVKSGQEIHELLFTPPLRTPIKTLDIPVAGQSHSAQTLPLIFELVNLANDQRVIDASKGTRKIEPSPAAATGEESAIFLRNARRIIGRIVGTDPSSLGLHPAVYFYSASGRHQPTSFLAVVSLIKEFEQRDQFASFTSVRRKFEDFLLSHKDFPNQVTVRMGSGVKGFDRLKNLYQKIIADLISGQSDEEIVKGLSMDGNFFFLKATAITENANSGPNRQRFNAAIKSETFLSQALESPVRCRICAGLIHVMSMTTDHITRIREGGLGELSNAQLAHPYCNSTVKN